MAFATFSAPVKIPNPATFEGAFIIGSAVAGQFLQRALGPKPLRSMASALSLNNLKMEIHDLSRLDDDPDPDLPRHLEVHFNPKEVKRSIKAVWKEIAIPGQSQNRLQYHLTENMPIRFDLHFDAMQQVAEGAIRGFDDEDDGIAQPCRFLESLCYARAGAQSVRDGAPPRVLFYWPNYLSLNCIVAEQEWTDTLFFADGSPRRRTCSMLLKEIRDTRLSSSDVLRGGSRRDAVRPPTKGEQVIRVTEPIVIS